jgi:hypothetical protein
VCQRRPAGAEARAAPCRRAHAPAPPPAGAATDPAPCPLPPGLLGRCLPHTAAACPIPLPPPPGAAHLLQHAPLLRLLNALDGIILDRLLLAPLVHHRVLALAYLLVDAAGGGAGVRARGRAGGRAGVARSCRRGGSMRRAARRGAARGARRAGRPPPLRARRGRPNHTLRGPPGAPGPRAAGWPALSPRPAPRAPRPDPGLNWNWFMAPNAGVKSARRYPMSPPGAPAGCPGPAPPAARAGGRGWHAGVKWAFKDAM